MNWIENYLRIDGHHLIFNYNQIWEYIDNNYPDDPDVLHSLWIDIAKYWLNKLIAIKHTHYSIVESDNFVILSSQSLRYTDLFLSFLERKRKKILSLLKNIASDNGYGKHVVIILDDMDSYIEHISPYYPEDGEFGLSSGIYLNHGYGHFIFPYENLDTAESVATHEMTHALLSHLYLPRWLDEGLATNIENALTGGSPLRMTPDIQQRHRDFWNSETIQNFWMGDSFSQAGEAQELSYHLAQLILSILAKNYDALIAFVNNANFEDAGNQAIEESYGLSLNKLIQEFIGVGNWTPNIPTKI